MSHARVIKWGSNCLEKKKKNWGSSKMDSSETLFYVISSYSYLYMVYT